MRWLWVLWWFLRLSYCRALLPICLYIYIYIYIYLGVLGPGPSASCLRSPWRPLDPWWVPIVPPRCPDNRLTCPKCPRRPPRRLKRPAETPKMTPTRVKTPPGCSTSSPRDLRRGSREGKIVDFHCVVAFSASRRCKTAQKARKDAPSRPRRPPRPP